MMFLRCEFCEIYTAHDFIKGKCKVYTKKMKIPQYSIERRNGGKLIFANSVHRESKITTGSVAE